MENETLDRESERKQIISEYFSELSKKEHKNNPRPREFYVRLGKMPHKRGRTKKATE